jgi:HSP20 family protein
LIGLKAGLPGDVPQERTGMRARRFRTPQTEKRTMSESRTPVPQPAAEPPAPRAEPWQPLASLRGEMDRLFDNFWRGVGAPVGAAQARLPRLFEGAFGAAAPALDLVETETAYRLTAELPGMDAKDVELTLAEDMLTIKGEKKEEREEKAEGFHLSERRYGSFQRALPLPRGVDRTKVEARFDKGVLTVVLPKAPEAAAAKTRIEIKPGG